MVRAVAAAICMMPFGPAGLSAFALPQLSKYEMADMNEAEAHLPRRRLKNLLQFGTGDTLCAGERLRIAKDRKGHGVGHQLRPPLQHDITYSLAIHSDTRQPVSGSESVFGKPTGKLRKKQRECDG